MKRDVACIAGIMGFSLLALVSLTPAPANADDFLYNFNTTFSGTSPTPPSPWVSVEFKDISPGTVSITFSGAGLQGSEYVDELYLNFNPSLDPTTLSFAQTGKVGSFADPGIKTGENAYMADGDGQYDIEFNFLTDNSDRFVLGDSVTYQVTSTGSLNADDFQATSEHGGGAGQWLAAAHINAIAPNGLSGWDAPSQITPVPEPSSALLLFLATGLYAGTRRLRNRNGNA